MNFKQMQDRVKYTLGMEESAWNDELVLIKGWLNDGVVNILVRTRPYTRCIDLVLAPNTKIHDVSNSILALVDLATEQGFLERYTREDITRRQATGQPGFAYEEPMLWISPVPSAATEITAYGVFRPASMVADADDPATPSFGGLSPEFHETIILYALWKAGEYVQHEGSTQGERWRMQYEGQDGTEGEIARIKRTISKRVTPQFAVRRDLAGNLGSLSESGSYIGVR
jgi:hypothetical protein